ncbi:MAG: glycosyl transferase family 36 [Rhodanobacteraceae bacterium]
MPRRSRQPQTAAPYTTILANDEYAVMTTASGSGYSRWRDLAITRWREDATRDPCGSFIYLRDLRRDAAWTPTLQPFGDGNHIESDLRDHVARYARRVGALTTTLEIAVDPVHMIEVRGIGLRNNSGEAREVDVTSYLELVLGPRGADASHPAFSKMFVQTQFVPESGVLLATRRKREPSDPDVWAAHTLVIDGERIGALQYETDRAQFIGRDCSLRNPRALDQRACLSGATGTVLDPIFSLRARVRVAPHSTLRLAFVTAAAESRRAALALIERNASVAACAKVFQRASAQPPKSLRKLGIDAQQARGFQRLADALLYAASALRASPRTLAKGEGGVPVLWAKGISGDLPIALLRIHDSAQIGLVDEILCAQNYWRAKHLPVDLVILNDAGAGKVDALQKTLEASVAKAVGKTRPDKSQGAIFVLRGDQLDDPLRNGLMTVARIVLDGKNGTLDRQLSRLPPLPLAVRQSSTHPRRVIERRVAAERVDNATSVKSRSLEFFNGLGGFDGDGREYVTILRNGCSTPMPWTHVVANPDFGFLATTTGGGYCWSQNSQQNQLTPWSNDAVIDPPSETFYLRDDDSGALWSACASPIRLPGVEYTTRFGPGYAKFETEAHGIESELLQFVPLEGSLKISRLRLRNRNGKTRRLSIVAYVEWALGAIGTNVSPYGVTSIDDKTRAVFARNAWRDAFGERIAFADMGGKQSSCTGDRGEFIGLHGSPESPAAMADSSPLSGRTGAGLDACAALRTTIELQPDAASEIVFLLGEEGDPDKARASIEHWRGVDLDTALAQVETQWDDVLGTAQVKTPEPSMDLLLNRCLLYQVLACRLWARTAFYQASGAYGFRDQLQDVTALCVARPDLAREHILRAAGRQFVEGDVQHWWLPPGGKGVRTRVTDDRLWLPYVVAHYSSTTGDSAVLDESAPFLTGDALKSGQNESFFQPAVADEAGSVFEHCARAIEASLALGKHGLPLMGTGDWNDGMNRVGVKGKGESVWLGWFLLAVLNEFAPIAQTRGEPQRAAAWRKHAQGLREALNKHAWDGAWFRRAYYDDGTPLGSKRDTECRIDSIAQSWSVISGGADPEKAARAMRSVDEQLVRKDDGLVALFTAPFDKTHHDPGYIKGYPPGIRENGGQYTHGSIWSAIAFAQLGEGDKAYELFRIFDPILHSATTQDARHYKVEPYVVCADVYSVAPHVGRGGWTWYSGSAAWLYRAGLETMLGFQLRGASLRIDPCIPKAWPGFEIAFRYHSSHYAITVENPHGICRGVTTVELDGSELKDASMAIPLADDGAQHHIRVVLGGSA